MSSHEKLFVSIQKAVENERNKHENVAKNFCRLYKMMFTVSVDESLVVMKPLAPTIIRPTIADPQPK